MGVVRHGQGGGLAASLSSADLCGLMPDQFTAALSTPVLHYLTAKASPAWAMQQQQRLQALQQQQQQHVVMQQQQQYEELSPRMLSGQQQFQQQQQQVQPAGSAYTWGLKVRRASVMVFLLFEAGVAAVWQRPVPPVNDMRSSRCVCVCLHTNTNVSAVECRGVDMFSTAPTSMGKSMGERIRV